METIKERAIKYATLPSYLGGFDTGDYDAYLAGAYKQRAIDIEKFKHWFTIWWEQNEYIPLDVCLKSIDKTMEE